MKDTADTNNPHTATPTPHTPTHSQQSLTSGSRELVTESRLVRPTCPVDPTSDERTSERARRELGIAAPPPGPRGTTGAPGASAGDNRCRRDMAADSGPGTEGPSRGDGDGASFAAKCGSGPAWTWMPLPDDARPRTMLPCPP